MPAANPDHHGRESARPRPRRDRAPPRRDPRRCLGPVDEPQRAAEELERVVQRVASICPEAGTFAVAGDSFAMLPHYDSYIGKLVELQSRYNYPRRILTNTGKNRHDRVLDAIERLHGGFYVDVSVRSMNPSTLKAIKRRNISIEACMAVNEAACATIPR